MPVSEAFVHEEFTGTHDPIGIFRAAGGPVTHASEQDRISVLDIAPLIHYLAGDRIPDDLEGAAPTRFLDAAYLKATPVVLAPAAEFPSVAGDGNSVTEPASEELTEKLRALGYVE